MKTFETAPLNLTTHMEYMNLFNMVGIEFLEYYISELDKRINTASENYMDTQWDTFQEQYKTLKLIRGIAEQSLRLTDES